MNLTLLKQRCAEAEQAMAAARACAGDPHAEIEAASRLRGIGPHAETAFKAALALQVANLARASALRVLSEGGRI